MNQQQVQLTKQGYDEMQSELQVLKDEKLPKAIERVATARSFGDLSENAEYHSAREDLAFIEGKVQELEALLANANVVASTASKKKKSQVDIGCKVTVKNGRQQHVYHIVGEWEANPLEKKISHQSPLGKALVGKTVGQEIEIEVPAGKIKYSIIDIA